MEIYVMTLFLYVFSYGIYIRLHVPIAIYDTLNYPNIYLL
jgi:hypothetical protein